MTESSVLSLSLIVFSVWCAFYALRNTERASTLLVVSWVGYGLKVFLLAEWTYTDYVYVWGASLALFLGINYFIQIKRLLSPKQQPPSRQPKQTKVVSEPSREWFQQ